MGGGANVIKCRQIDAGAGVQLQRERLPFRITLPLAPSINALFGQAPGRKRYPMPAYKAWIEEAGWLLKQSHPPRYPGQIWLAITYPDSGRLDLDNRIKMYPDLLKKHGVIVDDSDGKPPDRHFISWFGSGISNKRPQDLGDLIFVE